ncbi:toxin-antitoxin system YwqK family antitoxin [Candidatus Palauibacter sp.]|uniref:toxin-antitoxin system YwqK family antitoxin n=1 Tax=Candidatus Palauibacter sp. TaxID=3101350 RepID=UPI003B0259AD
MATRRQLTGLRYGLLCPLAVAASTGVLHAQRLLEVEGIELRGSARVVEYGAGTCNVSEERETAASYEQKKANHGQPVDVWQLDFSVYNGSGRPLDHLIANYRVASENPPCTNWSWPDAGRYPGPIEWGDLAGFIQRSGSGNPTPPGETLTDTKYVFAFHDHAPRFDTWSVDYTFAADAPAAGAENPPVPAGGADIRPQPGEERLDPPGSPVGGVPGAAALPFAGAGETCAGKPVGSECWMEVANQPGCHLWNPSLHAGATARWSGECVGSYTQGTGTVRWRYDGGLQTADGSFLDGKQHGTWVVHEADGDVSEGLYVDGQRQGIWTWWFTSGNVLESPFANGKENGQEIECARLPGNVIALLISYVAGEEIDRETIGPSDPDAPTIRTRCAALLSKPRPTP